MVTKVHLSVVPTEPPKYSDAEIVEGLIAREPSATLALHARYGDRINRLVWRNVRSSSDHNDVINEVYVKILKQIHTLKSPEALEKWIVSITLNTARLEMRSRKRRYGWGFKEKNEFPVQRDNQESVRRTRSVFAVLDKMKPEYQIVFVLRTIEQYSIPEIAEATGRSVSTVNRQVVAAKTDFMKIASRDVVLKSMIGGELDG